MDDSKQWIFGTAQQAKLHKDMCRRLSIVLSALVQVFPALEAVRPGCKQGMQALSALNLALGKAKALLQHCASSSKLYLAMTGDCIVVKFTRVSNDMDQNLMQLAEIVSESLSNEVVAVLTEISRAKFFLDPSEKQIGADVISLLLKEKDNDAQAIDVLFDQVATRLGLISPKAAFDERQALKKLLDKAQNGGDQKKASILLYFLHLLKNYSKSIKSNSSNAIDVQTDVFSSNASRRVTRSKTVAWCTNAEHLYKQPETSESGRLLSVSDAPEQFRCPMSLQLMCDPVIIASGQTYERAFIEQWFQHGNQTCPRTQQLVQTFSVTPNTCVKNLITFWCQRNGIPVPENPPSPDLSVFSWNSQSFSSLDSSMEFDENLVNEGTEPACEMKTLQHDKGGDHSPKSQVSSSTTEECFMNKEGAQRSDNIPGSHREWWLQDLEQLFENICIQDWEIQCRSARNVRLLTRDIPNALAYITDNHMTLLVDFLGNALQFGCIKDQEVGVLILLDLSIFNRKNEERMVASGVVPHLVELLKVSHELRLNEVALSLLMVLSCSEANLRNIGSSGAIPVLVELLDSRSGLNQSDIIMILCNLSTVEDNQRHIIQSDAVPRLVHLLKAGNNKLPAKCLLVLCNISSLEAGRFALMEVEDSVSIIVEFLRIGSDEEHEHAAAVLLLLCNHSSAISHLIRREGVTSHLLSLSVQGSETGKDAAWGLLQLLQKQQWQKEVTWQSQMSDAGSSTLMGNTRTVSLTYS